MFPIDLLHFEFDVLASMDASSIHKGPSDGVYIFGLFIENAKWNAVDRCLQEPAPGEMQSQIPVIHFIPKYRPPKNLKDGVGKELKLKRSTLDDEEDDEIYKCPVYKTSARAGVLSTTGQSTNFILTVNLPCGVPDTEEIKLKRAAGVELSERSVDSGIIQRMSAEFWTLRGAAMLTMLNS
jgi:dynein heavy chain